MQELAIRISVYYRTEYHETDTVKGALHNILANLSLQIEYLYEVGVP